MQLNLWDQATPDEIREAKQLLSRYRRMQAICKTFDEMSALSERQQQFREQCQKNLNEIGQAVNLILDDEVKRIVEMIYIKGIKHKVTVLNYNGMMHPSTVDRKLAKGIESVANTLKLIR